MHFCPVKIRRGFESSSVCVGMYNSGITNALARVPDGQDKKSLALLSVLFFGQPPLFKEFITIKGYFREPLIACYIPRET